MVLNAIFDLKMDYRANLERRANDLIAKRKASQPPGASASAACSRTRRRFRRKVD